MSYNPCHLKKLNSSTRDDWTRWRRENPNVVPALEGCKPDRPTLRGYDLKKASLAYAKLQRVDLQEADLHSADLWCAELQLAELQSANLQNANLWGACLDLSCLVDANLRGAKVPIGSLLKAKLWSPTRNQKRADCCADSSVRFIQNLVQFVTNCGDLKSKQDNSQEKMSNGKTCSECVVYYRGASCYCHEPIPSVMRSDNHKKNESEMLTDLIARRPEDFEKDTMAMDQWSRARHYDLPTRLLDITTNPLVALYFASQECTDCRGCKRDGRIDVFNVPKELIKRFNSDTIRVIANFAKLEDRKKMSILEYDQDRSNYDRSIGDLYQHIRQERFQFEELIDPLDLLKVFVVKPRLSFERIRAQSGAFLMSAYHSDFGQETINREMKKSSDNSTIPLYCHSLVRVPCRDKQSILNGLKMLGVTREVLFPGLQEAAAAVRSEY